ncbi:MAG: cardiolipin synthase [Pseudomonadota bacterium]
MAFEISFVHIAALAVFYLAAAACVVHAIMDTRTAQGAVAWIIGLISFPFIVMPLYLLIGRRKFQGYVTARQLSLQELRRIDPLGQLLDRTQRGDPQHDDLVALEALTRLPFTKGNAATLLIDGEATFDAIFKGIDQAQDYVLVQFYILRDDGLGRRLADCLKRATARGVSVHLLYDEIGSSRTRKAFWMDLRDAGIAVSSFNSTRRRFQPWQINFRNHRKIVVIDGREAFVGGHNVGDEYLGLDLDHGHWRDTHVAVRGPIVTSCQAAFAEDWYWATEQRLELVWGLEASAEEDRRALVLASGPADRLETAALFFGQLIATAEERLWLVSPYFVPDHAILASLQLAALRGVDVRIILPNDPDHLVVWLASFSFLKEAGKTGIKFYCYTGGFLHQKVALVDDHLASIGTVNLDNRSLRLNFEITLLFDDRDFAKQVEAMLLADLQHCRLYDDSELARRSWFFRFGSRAARLAAPLL